MDGAARSNGRAAWPEWALMAALYLAALWPRLALVEVPPYGDEGLHFAVARHWLDAPPNFHDPYGNNWWHASYIFFQRPAFYVAFHAAALLSFDAFRLTHAFLAALLPVVGYGLLRAHGTGRVAASAGGLGLAALPFFVTWGTLVLMDTLMAVLLLAGLWAWQAGRPLLAAALLLLAVWTKETALFAVAALLAWTLWAGWRRARTSPWPLNLDHGQTALLAALALGPLPILVAMSRGLRTPGGLAHGSLGSILELTAFSAWLLPVLALGLALRRSRALAAWGLGAILFFALLHGLLGRAVEAWYAVPSAALAVLAAAATASAAWVALPRRRALGGALGALLLLGGVAAAAVPAGDIKDRAIHPLTGDTAPSIADSWRYETQTRAQDLKRIAAFVEERQPARLLLYDLFYGFAYVPFVASHPNVMGASSLLADLWPQPYGPLAQAIEGNGTLTVIEAQESPLNLVLRDLYAPCAVLMEGPYTVYEGWRCPGKLAELEALVPYPVARG